MSSETAHSPGILEAAGDALDGVLETVQTRVRLLGVELQEEKLRMVQLAIWIAAAVFSAGMVMTFLSATLVYLLWERAPVGVLVGLTVFYAVCFFVIVRQFRRFLARQPVPFDTTLGEIKKDRACLRPVN